MNVMLAKAVLGVALMGSSLACGSQPPESLPTPSPSAPDVSVRPENVQKWVDEAIAKRQRRVVIPPGNYRIDAPANAGAHLTWNGARDLEIDATGVTLIFTDPNRLGISFHDVQNLRVTGLTIDYDPLPFTQGMIVGMDDAAGWYDVRLDAGYPADPAFFTSRTAAYVYDPGTRLLKPGSYDLYPSKVTLERPGVLRVWMRDHGIVGRNNAVVGDLLMLGRRTAGAIRFNSSANVQVEGVTIFAAGGIAIQEAHGPGGNRYSYTVTRGPTPAGASVPRLHSTNADAFHSAYVEKGPIVENCRFEYQGDDGIAIHGTYALVTADSTSRTITVSPKYELPLAVGDELRVLDGQTYALKETARVVHVTAAPSPQGEELEAVTNLWEKYRSDVKGRRFHQVTLDRPIHVAVGDLVSSFGRNGSGFVVRNNVLRHNRARGILIKASDGVVEHNLIEGSTFAGIALGPEIPVWLGSDFATNVVVRDNVIRDTGYCANAHRSATNLVVAGIAVHAAGLNGRYAAGYQNRNLLIENNLIERPAGAGMLITSASEVTVRGNRIVAPHAMPGATHGSRFDVDASAAIYVDAADGVWFKGNDIQLAGGHARHPLAVGPDVRGIAGDLEVDAASHAPAAAPHPAAATTVPAVPTRRP